MTKIYIIQNNLKDDAALLERIKVLGEWLKYFPGSVLLKSELSAHQIYDKISVGYETERIFIIELYKKNFWGVMPKSVWPWLEDKD